MKRRTFGRAAAAAIAPAALLLLGACEAKSPAAAATAAAGTSASAAGADRSAAYNLAATGHGFAVGPMMAAHTVYVFFDAACPHCAHLWTAAQPLATRLKIVWLPVALLRKTSGPQGATILAAQNPAAKMAENEAAVLAQQPGIAADPALPAEVLDKVQANTEIFGRLGADGVPLIVYRNARTGEYGMQSGATDTAGLAALAGI